jgi:hypothetical protein
MPKPPRPLRKCVCKTCQHFRAYPPEEGPDLYGQCRKKPPVIVQVVCPNGAVGNITTWPEARFSDWCGEWEASTPPLPMYTSGDYNREMGVDDLHGRGKGNPERSPP